ncbi:hypothetical protein F4774DRAFT_372911 [Daldinia eschscholtzii]|nr:hypothetical protein F4774DRAFT_372911 [Daldinia eschscholtzii]
MHSKTRGEGIRHLLLFLSLLPQQIYWWLSSIACLIADSPELSHRPLFPFSLGSLKIASSPHLAHLNFSYPIHTHSLVSSSFVNCCA